MTLARQLVKDIVTWPVASQQVARRNALVASTVLADRRRERYDVEEFLASYPGARTTGPVQVEAKLVVG